MHPAIRSVLDAAVVDQRMSEEKKLALRSSSETVTYELVIN